MIKRITFLLFLCSSFIYCQKPDNSVVNIPFIFTPEVLIGITGESNTNFPDRKLQKQFILNLGWDHSNNSQEWAQRLKGTRAGISIGYTDFGNSTYLGSAISLLPFIEFNAFKLNNLKVHIGTGISYFNKKYDSISNPNNQAVSTDLTWSFRIFSYYKIHNSEKIDWRIGAGYSHHSNGHSKLPNQGYNSFLFSFSADIKRHVNTNVEATKKKEYTNSKYNYFSFRVGYGANVLSKSFNTKKDVYTVSGEYGKVYNHTFKLGIGLYYRFYQNYYDYIINNESLVQDGREFDYLKDNPKWNASNIGLSINGEIFLNHIGIDLQVGFNIHKPGYKIDWRINQGWFYVPREIPEDSNIVLGEFNSYYEIKSLISTRLGLKYYLIGTKESPKSNIYVGVFINANLGQADFNEISLGYVYRLDIKK